MLPFILGAGAAIAGAAGIGSGIKGASKMKEANERFKEAEERHNRNINRFERLSKSSTEKMDSLGQLELEILESFEKFSETIEKIQNRPQFKKYEKDGVSIPEYDGEQLRSVSIGAGVLLGSIGGAALGTAGGFAAAGAATSAVMAFGTASTGAAISGLHGAALTNATLAALGGGALGSSTFAGGMALGSTILGATTFGVGLLVGGLIFEATGTKLSEQADEAEDQMRRAARTINAACDYLAELELVAERYYKSLDIAKKTYEKSFRILFDTVNVKKKYDWIEFTEEEKTATQNTVLLVGLLYKMCQVSLVKKAQGETELNSINRRDVKLSLDESERVIEQFEQNDEVYEEELLGTTGKEEGEFVTNKGKVFRLANRKINWNDFISYFGNMSSDTKIIEVYNCDLYFDLVKKEKGIKLQEGDVLIFTECRFFGGEYWYEDSMLCEAGSQAILKDCILKNNRRLFRLEEKSKVVISNCRLEYPEELIYSKKEGNCEIRIEKSEIIYPRNSFINTTGDNVKTSIIECSLVLDNKYSSWCICTSNLTMDRCYVSAQQKKDEKSLWLQAHGADTVIKNCTMKNLNLSMWLGSGKIYRCHFELCVNIISGVYEVDSSVFNQCSIITKGEKIPMMNNCLFNRCIDLWGHTLKDSRISETYFMNVRGPLGGNYTQNCQFENCVFENILVGEKGYETGSYYLAFYSAFYLSNAVTSFVGCEFNNIDVYKQYFIECYGDKDLELLRMENCEFNDCISRREDGLFIKDVVDEKTYTLAYSEGGFKAYDSHLTGRQFNVATYQNVSQNNCRTETKKETDLEFKESYRGYITELIREKRIGSEDTLETMDWDSNLASIEEKLAWK